MKAILDGKIKEGSRFRDTYSEYIYKRNSFGDLELKREDGEGLTSPDYSYFAEKDNDFELIEDEIDIDSIEELKKKDKQIEKYQNMLVTNDMLHIKESQEKDKIIDLMSNEILVLDIKRANMTYDKARIWETEKGIKQYFENKAKEE